MIAAAIEYTATTAVYLVNGRQASESMAKRQKGTTMNGRLESAETARTFALAGNARLTLVSEKTGARFTYRVRVSKPRKEGDSPVHFVSLLNGADNDADYVFLGTIFEGTWFRHGRKSTVSPSAPSAKAFAWAWDFVKRGALPPKCELWHEGRCGRCGRALTVPESIETGLGPVCAEKGAA